jgi:hypothetical protein
VCGLLFLSAHVHGRLFRHCGADAARARARLPQRRPELFVRAQVAQTGTIEVGALGQIQALSRPGWDEVARDDISRIQAEGVRARAALGRQF